MSNLLINADLTSEFLSHEEVKELTGTQQLKRQLTWLQERDWQFEVNHRNQIMISRWYLRWKMSGVTLSSLTLDKTTEPDFGAIR